MWLLYAKLSPYILGMTKQAHEPYEIKSKPNTSPGFWSQLCCALLELCCASDNKESQENQERNGHPNVSIDIDALLTRVAPQFGIHMMRKDDDDDDDDDNDSTNEPRGWMQKMRNKFSRKTISEKISRKNIQEKSLILAKKASKTKESLKDLKMRQTEWLKNKAPVMKEKMMKQKEKVKSFGAKIKDQKYKIKKPSVMIKAKQRMKPIVQKQKKMFRRMKRR